MKKIDISIINRWNNGSFKLLYEGYYRSLALLAGDITRSASAAEDLVEEVFVSLLRRRVNFASQQALTCYLYNAVRNRAINYVRNNNNSGIDVELLEEEFTPYSITDDADTFDAEKVLAKIMEEIEKMPKRQREIFLMVMEGRKNAEIAHAMNISETTVKTQKMRAMKRLHDKFKINTLPLLVFGI